MLELKTPYVLFLGAAGSRLEAKTACGLAHWRPQACVGQWRLPGCQVDLELPEMDAAAAKAAGAASVIIGCAPSGGGLHGDWIAPLVEALQAGLDVVSGLHTALGSVDALRDAAKHSGSRLVDVRIPPADIPLASGQPRSGKRLLTVGTDCCVGKKYTALALHRAMQETGMQATFRATGQTGIMIAGGGIPMDAVVSDFLAGAAEMLSPANNAQHWDVIEGQGSLFHPAYAAVTLGQIHGSQPDALVLCHEAGRQHIDEYPDYPIPPLPLCIERYLQAAALTHPGVRCIGMSINTSNLPAAERSDFLQQLTRKSGLPCVDPVLSGVDALLPPLAAIS